MDRYIRDFSVFEILEWATQEAGDEDLLVDLLSIVADNRGYEDIGRAIDARVCDTLDMMDVEITMLQECPQCHGSGGLPPELPCISCGGRGTL